MADTNPNVPMPLQDSKVIKIAHCSPKAAFKKNGTGTGIQKVSERGHTNSTWLVATWKSPDLAAIAAIEAVKGANNKRIQYSQKTRREIFTYGMSYTKKNYHADCVSFIEQAMRIATGKKSLTLPGKWNASGKTKTIRDTGYFENIRTYKKGMELCVGDLMWRYGAGWSGHIVMVVAGKARTTKIDTSILASIRENDTDITLDDDFGYDMSQYTSTLVSSANYKWVNDDKSETKEQTSYKVGKTLDQMQADLSAGLKAFRESTAVDISKLLKDIADNIKSTITRKGFAHILKPLNASPTLVEAPFAELILDDTTIGSYNSSVDKYPNLLNGLTVNKINGEVNQYSINLVYQIRPGEDPQMVDKLLSKVKLGGEFRIRYGDCSSGKIFSDTKLVLMDVKQSRSYSTSRINYTLIATSACHFVGTYNTNFKQTKAKPSSVIFDLLYNSGQVSKLLMEAFPGMKNKQKVMSKGLIPTDDALLEISSAVNIDPLTYINALVSSMQSSTNTNKSSYFITYCNDEDGKMGGAYFKISKMSKDTKINSNNVYSLTVGYPDLPIYAFSVNTTDGWSILKENKSVTEYLYTMESSGEVKKRHSRSLVSSSQRETAGDTNWWNFVTTFPINATITLRGLLKPVMLTDYVHLDVLFYGQKHLTSGNYIITAQQDSLDGSGFRTTLNLVRTGD